MSLRKKIMLGFFLSAFIIAMLAVFEYASFVQIRSEIKFLEVTDSIRSKSLQLRRHEKNFFLYSDREHTEQAVIHDYISQLETLAESLKQPSSDEMGRLVADYRERFTFIEKMLLEIRNEFGRNKEALAGYSKFLPIIEAGVRDRPRYIAGFLEKNFSMTKTHPLVKDLNLLQVNIDALRKTGEDIIEMSKRLDKRARDEADNGIGLAQTAILVVFPVFLFFGLGTLYHISNDVVRRLQTLTSHVEKVGRRYAPSEAASQDTKEHKDEVAALIEKFSNMDSQLDLWEEELQQKNEEILRSKKLAAIGTMASGVAHELNNPLNNISLSAQVLRRSMPEGASQDVREIVEDIVGQTQRVKGIVGDMLEFAREREPQLRRVELNSIIMSAYNLVRATTDMGEIKFTLEADSGGVFVMADSGQMERVFVNLMSNAIAALEGNGELTVKVERIDGGRLKVYVSDNGKGMSEEDREKVFDPFFTKKEKGTGLGLAIVMGIIRKHGGDISVVSELGEGTAFEITLPEAGG